MFVFRSSGSDDNVHRDGSERHEERTCRTCETPLGCGEVLGCNAAGWEWEWEWEWEGDDERGDGRAELVGIGADGVNIGEESGGLAAAAVDAVSGSGQDKDAHETRGIYDARSRS